jgi:hypothetical protein
MASFPDGSDDEPRGREGGDGFRTIDILPVQLCRHGQQQAEMGPVRCRRAVSREPFGGLSIKGHRIVSKQPSQLLCKILISNHCRDRLTLTHKIARSAIAVSGVTFTFFASAASPIIPTAPQFRVRSRDWSVCKPSAAQAAPASNPGRKTRRARYDHKRSRARNSPASSA